MVPHCFDHVQSLQNLDASQCLVIDALSWHEGFHRLCSDVDHGLPRQPLTVSWDHVAMVDFKVVGHAPDLRQLTLLRKFLMNNRRDRVLHVALDNDGSVEWLDSLMFCHRVILDLHDVHSVQSASSRLHYVSNAIINVNRYSCVDYHHRPSGFYHCLKPHAAKLTV